MSFLELINSEIEWMQNESDNRFFNANYKGIDLLLKMNDFPVEPLYTLFWMENNKDIEDKPEKWIINYTD